MARLIQARFTDEMLAAADVVKRHLANQGFDVTMTAALRYALRLARADIEGVPIKDVTPSSEPPPSRSGIPTPQWTAKEEARIGKAPDAEVAARLGRSAAAVGKRRRALGIPAFESPTRRWSSKEERLLGKAPDDVVAIEIGRTPVAVWTRRRALGIPAFTPKAGRPKTKK